MYKRILVPTDGSEITAKAVSVLAESALPKAEVTQEVYNGMIAEAKAAFDNAKEVFKNEPGPVDDAAKLLADMVAIGGHIGLSAS